MHTSSLFFVIQLDCTLNFVGTQAPGANLECLGGSVYNRFNRAHIRFPGAVGSSVRVGNLNTEGYTFSTNFTFCHLFYTSCR